MYGIFAYIYHENQPNVGKYTLHGWYGLWTTSKIRILQCRCTQLSTPEKIQMSDVWQSKAWWWFQIFLCSSLLGEDEAILMYFLLNSLLEVRLGFPIMTPPNDLLGGGFMFFNVHPYLGQLSNLTNMFHRGWNHQLEKIQSYVFSFRILNGWGGASPQLPPIFGPEKILDAFPLKHPPPLLENPRSSCLLWLAATSMRAAGRRQKGLINPGPSSRNRQRVWKRIPLQILRACSSTQPLSKTSRPLPAGLINISLTIGSLDVFSVSRDKVSSPCQTKVPMTTFRRPSSNPDATKMHGIYTYVTNRFMMIYATWQFFVTFWDGSLTLCKGYSWPTTNDRGFLRLRRLNRLFIAQLGGHLTPKPWVI